MLNTTFFNSQEKIGSNIIECDSVISRWSSDVVSKEFSNSYYLYLPLFAPFYLGSSCLPLTFIEMYCTSTV